MPPGRNDPCPCGSGKKYKKCCMLKEKPSTVNLTVRLLRKTSEEVNHLLLAYAKKLHGDMGLLEAWNDFWLGEPQERFSYTSPHLQLFMPWFMYHWYPDAERLYDPEGQFPCEHTVVAQFLKRRGRSIDPFTRRYLENAQGEPLTFWQAEDVEPGKGILLRDMVTDRTCYVHEVSGSQIIEKWDIVFGHVVGVDGEYILTGTSSYTLPPSRFRGYVTACIDRIRQNRTLTPSEVLEYDVDFLICYHDCVEQLLNPIPPEIRNTDGEKLDFTTSTYVFDPAYRDTIVSKLESMRNFEYLGDEEGEAEFAWTIENKKRAGMPSVTKGNMRVAQERLFVECNSRPRDRKLRQRLEKNLGELIAFQETTHKPFDLENLPESEDRSGTDLDALPEEVRQELAAHMEQVYMNWVDERIPALENQTPREAVKTAEGRKQVIDLINDWENSELRRPAPQFEFDFSKLRRELGLRET